MAQPVISVQILRHVANCLELTGQSALPLLARLGISREAMESHDGTILLADFLRFFEEAAVQARNPHFGLAAGRVVSSDSLGPLSFLFLSAPSLRQAFESFTRFLETMQEASLNAFRIEPDGAVFEYAVTDQSLSGRRQDAEYSIAAMHSLARQYLGGDFVLEEVCFEHEMAGDYARYRDFFGCEVLFEQEGNSLRFPLEFLDRSGRVLSAGLYPILEDHLSRRSHQHHSDSGLAVRVRQAVEALPLGRRTSASEIAGRLGMSVATLNRGLRAEATTWREISAGHRLRAAARLLRESRRSIADIALAMGFAEGASFTRAFRRAYGTSPLRYRRGEAGQ